MFFFEENDVGVYSLGQRNVAQPKTNTEQEEMARKICFSDQSVLYLTSLSTPWRFAALRLLEPRGSRTMRSKIC
jgi:hypothetical protein